MRERLSYSNVMATIALFVALGGGAYALSEDSVGSRQLKDNAVKKEHIASDSVGGSEMVNDAIVGRDVEADSLDNTDIDESTLNAFELPVYGVLSARIEDIGVGGSTMFGGPSGATTASTRAAVEMGLPDGTTEYANLRVTLPAALAAGQTRTFTVVRGSAGLVTSFSCTISEGESFCTDDDKLVTNSERIAIKIESVGAGLSLTDDALVGMFAKNQNVVGVP